MDLKSSDEEVSKKAMEKADGFIAALEEPCRTKTNRTRINTAPSRQDSLVKVYTQRPKNRGTASFITTT